MQIEQELPISLFCVEWHPLSRDLARCSRAVVSAWVIVCSNKCAPKSTQCVETFPQLCQQDIMQLLHTITIRHWPGRNIPIQHLRGKLDKKKRLNKWSGEHICQVHPILRNYNLLSSVFPRNAPQICNAKIIINLLFESAAQSVRTLVAAPLFEWHPKHVTKTVNKTYI